MPTERPDLTIPRHHLRPPRQQILALRRGDRIDARTPIYPDDPFKHVMRELSDVGCIVFHESVTHDADVLEDDDHDKPDATERVLRRRRLGVHFMVGLDDDGKGVVVQHHSLDEVPAHIGRLNTAAVGIEVVTPYYPGAKGAPLPWQDVIAAPWADKKKYVLPLPEQCEQAFLLWSSLTDAFPGLGRVPAHDPKARTFAMGPVKLPARDFTAAHHHVGGHADAAWPLLYCVLRRDYGLTPALAYERAAQLATGVGAVVRL